MAVETTLIAMKDQKGAQSWALSVMKSAAKNLASLVVSTADTEDATVGSEYSC